MTKIPVITLAWKKLKSGNYSGRCGRYYLSIEKNGLKYSAYITYNKICKAAGHGMSVLGCKKWVLNKLKEI